LFFFPVKTHGIVSLKVLLRRWKEKYSNRLRRVKIKGLQVFAELK
jgi:hypothetical protein